VLQVYIKRGKGLADPFITLRHAEWGHSQAFNMVLNAWAGDRPLISAPEQAPPAQQQPAGPNSTPAASSKDNAHAEQGSKRAAETLQRASRRKKRIKSHSRQVEEEEEWVEEEEWGEGDAEEIVTKKRTKPPPEAVVDTSDLLLCSYCGRGLQSAGRKNSHEKACGRNPGSANYIAGVHQSDWDVLIVLGLGDEEDFLRCNKNDGRGWWCSESVYQNGTKCLKHMNQYRAKREREKRHKKSGKKRAERQECEKEEENREKKGKQNSAEVVQSINRSPKQPDAASPQNLLSSSRSKRGSKMPAAEAHTVPAAEAHTVPAAEAHTVLREETVKEEAVEAVTDRRPARRTSGRNQNKVVNYVEHDEDIGMCSCSVLLVCSLCVL